MTPDMRKLCALGLLLAIPCSAQTTAPQTYWAMLTTDGHTWCAFRDSGQFKSRVDREPPAESAAVMYQGRTVVELTHQVSSESGDWTLVDRYDLSKDPPILRRTNLLTQSGLKVIQEARIQSGKAEAFRIVSVTTSDGRNAELGKSDLPLLPVDAKWSTLAFVAVVEHLRARALSKWCE